MIVPHQPLQGGRSILDVVAAAQHRSRDGLLPDDRPLFLSAAPASPLALAERLADPATTVLGVTDHALLVILGQFATKLGLLDALQHIPIPQRNGDHTPQAKLIQFFVGILAGLEYLHDFNDAAHPLAMDRALIASWGQHAFAHYSSLSRTLAAADQATLTALQQALQTITQPFLASEVTAILRQVGLLLIDIDLTGRPVSPTSTSYHDADFGWMDDTVGKGYQALLLSLSGGPSGRLLLQGRRYPGRTQSAEVLQAALRLLEAQLGGHPRRRTELVAARIEALQQRHARTSALLAQAVAQQRQRFSAALTGRQTPQRREMAIGRLGRRIGRLQAEQQQLAQQIRTLECWHQSLAADNAQPTARLPIVLRLDAGFSTDANLSWLIELGYTIVTKAHSGQTTTRLLRRYAGAPGWRRVGANASALYVGPQQIAAGPYALHALLVRYQLPEAQRATTLLYYGDSGPPDDLAVWFEQYNARQIIEAGIKEGKQVFGLRRPLVRSEVGMQVQELLGTFAANFVRWAAAWLHQQVQTLPRVAAQLGSGLWLTLSQVKPLIRVVAHCRAWLVETATGRQLILDAGGPFAGAILPLSDQVVIQLVLPIFHGSDSDPGG
jgi:hypothetical protein